MGVGTGRDTISVRRHNLRTVLRHLHLSGPSTRVELGRVTGLTRSAVGDLVAELIARELVRESDSEASGGRRGRPSLLVAPRDDRARVLAVNIRADTLRAALVSLGGTVSEVGEVPHDHVPRDPGAGLDQLANLVRDRLDALAAPPLAVGISVPGLVRATDGSVALAPLLGWRDLPLVAELRRRVDVDVPVVTANESNLSALAEHLRGAGRNHDHMIYLHAELGVGGGFVVDGKLLLGGHPGYGGEVGHMVVDPGGLPCHCGGHGCWETQVGADAVLRHAGITVEGASGRRTALAELLARADDHDPQAQAALAALVRPLGAGIATLISLFNPERIILSGLFAHLLRHFEPELRDAVEYHRPALSNRSTDVVPAQLGGAAPLLGAAEAAIDAFLAAFATTRTGHHLREGAL
ncbi:ROK family transcriptional regulator [Pseudonocardia sichuanensis]